MACKTNLYIHTYMHTCVGVGAEMRALRKHSYIHTYIHTYVYRCRSRDARSSQTSYTYIHTCAGVEAEMRALRKAVDEAATSEERVNDRLDDLLRRCCVCVCV